MDCIDESLRVDVGVIVGGSGDTTNCMSRLKSESGYNCNQCLNLEENIKTIECNCLELRQGIEQKRNEFKLLEGKIEVLKRRNQELEEQIR
ncbi:hypothetical protein RDI58_008040 [Solanum bulbocastanum]|uniref:Uncharacterized protein n=1 Tax=Solanum bulbocastanum TaxID=147425 RepID=A0AAN8U2K6_SOLBU